MQDKIDSLALRLNAVLASAPETEGLGAEEGVKMVAASLVHLMAAIIASSLAEECHEIFIEGIATCMKDLTKALSVSEKK